MKDDNRHSFSCCNKISYQFEFICERFSFAKLLMTKVYIEKISKLNLKWNKYNLGELDGRSLNFEDCETQINYQDLHTKIWYVIMYLISYKILYEIHTYVSNLCIV